MAVKAFEQWMENELEKRFFTDKGKEATLPLWEGFFKDSNERVNLSAAPLGNRAARSALATVGVGLFSHPKKPSDTSPDVALDLKKDPGKTPQVK